MNTSAVTIPPSPASPPAPANSPDQSTDTSFSDELNRAQTKPNSPSPAQKTTVRKSAGKLVADSTQTKPAPEKTKTKVQQKQAAPTGAPTDPDAKSQKQSKSQTSDAPADSPPQPNSDQAAADADSDSDTHSDAEAEGTQVEVHVKLADGQALPATDAATDSSQTEASHANSKDGKSTKAPTESASPTDLATLLAAASVQQQPVALSAQTAKATSSNDAGDAVAQKQTVTKVSVSPFKSAHSPSGAPADSHSAPGQADAAAQSSDKDKAAAVVDPAPAPVTQLLVDDSASKGSAVSHVEQAAVAAPPSPAPAPDPQFADSNHPSIVAAIHSNLLPNGGTMSIRLDPPELGAIQINVRMEDGVMSASFQTSNDQATRLLSNTLGQLKTALETQGMSVDRLHVHQASNTENSSGQGKEGDTNERQSASDERSAQQDEQRRDILRRMWRRVRGNRDPLDLVA